MFGKSNSYGLCQLKTRKMVKDTNKNRFNSSRKLQTTKLHEDAIVEINDYGNDLSDVETFAKHIGIEINIIDAEQFNSIVHTANKVSKTRSTY